MHGADPHEFAVRISGFLGSYFLLISLMNFVAVLWLWLRRGIHDWRALAAPSAFALLAFIVAPFAYSGEADVYYWMLPPIVKETVNALAGAVTYTVGTAAALAIFFLGRRFFVKPTVAWTMLNLALVFMGLSMTDPNFAAIVTKPDNVPIVGLVFLLGFFTWLATYKAVINDERIARGLEPVEKLGAEKVLVWPDLVYTELICMIALTAFLLVWGIGLQAPLEEPASSVKTPNPSKAPWYFLGLQEMLVYYDPWMAGVVLPSLVIFGLMAVPFLDFNKQGNGYFTINQRRFAYIIFQIGFLELWVTLIILGTFLRGPNWNFFGPFEYWDPHKVLALNNVDLSEYFWKGLLNTGMPKAPEGAGFAVKLYVIVKREIAGIVLLGIYFGLLPPLLATTVFRKFFVRMGFIRYMVMINLLLIMALLPIKMICRWSFNLKYFIAIPEYFLNF
jgi:hypothetical protein